MDDGNKVGSEDGMILVKKIRVIISIIGPVSPCKCQVCSIFFYLPSASKWILTDIIPERKFPIDHGTIF